MNCRYRIGAEIDQGDKDNSEISYLKDQMNEITQGEHVEKTQQNRTGLAMKSWILYHFGEGKAMKKEDHWKEWKGWVGKEEEKMRVGVLEIKNYR